MIQRRGGDGAAAVEQLRPLDGGGARTDPSISEPIAKKPKKTRAATAVTATVTQPKVVVIWRGSARSQMTATVQRWNW